MNWDDVELRLLGGLPIEIEGVGKVISPKVKDVIRIGESKYNEYLSLMLFDKDNFEHKLDEDISDFELMYVYAYHNEGFRQQIYEAISFFTGEEARLDYDGQDVFFYLGEKGRLNKGSFGLFQDVICRANHVKKAKKEEPEFKPGNEQARKFMEKLKELKKNAPKKKDSITLHSMIAGMAWKSNSINAFNIFDLTIYQLRVGFMKLEDIDNYSHTLQGVYAGNIDSKNIKFDQIHWAKILK